MIVTNICIKTYMYCIYTIYIHNHYILYLSATFLYTQQKHINIRNKMHLTICRNFYYLIGFFCSSMIFNKIFISWMDNRA